MTYDATVPLVDPEVQKTSPEIKTYTISKTPKKVEYRQHMIAHDASLLSQS